jgi:hypothetical protein
MNTKSRHQNFQLQTGHLPHTIPPSTLHLADDLPADLGMHFNDIIRVIKIPELPAVNIDQKVPAKHPRYRKKLYILVYLLHFTHPG